MGLVVYKVMEKIGGKKGLVCSSCFYEWDHKSIKEKRKKK